MILKYDTEIQNDAIIVNLRRLTNQIYKLLPIREENGDWQKPLATIVEEVSGMDRLFLDQQPVLFKLLCKLEGLFMLIDRDDFQLYRSIIFECLSLLSLLINSCQD